MNPEYLKKMSAEELEAYAKSMGFTTAAAPDIEDKVRIIEGKRNRAAHLTVLGVDLEIPIKRANDKRVNDVLTRGGTRDELERAFRLLLGDAQYDELMAACVDEDGTVDEPAISYAYGALIESDELKNF